MAVHVEIPYQESLEKLKRGELTHAAHAMIYAKWPGALFGKYEHKYAVMVRHIHPLIAWTLHWGEHIERDFVNSLTSFLRPLFAIYGPCY